ncbi:MAG: DEAD/DEAH box helicase [Actinomycetales bacterium]|nr:DEAD/DEAH box helicase [Actinomycetales bacterium]
MKTPNEFALAFQADTKVLIEPSAEQWAAITAPLEPCIIVAGAGTGKTTTMASRISYLIATNAVDPEKILGLTFTKKATMELARAVRQRNDQAIEYRRLNFPSEQNSIDLLGEPTIATYHSFCARLLREHGLRIGIEPEARVLVDATRYQLARKVVLNTKTPLTDPEYNNLSTVVSAVLNLEDGCSDYLVDPQAVIKYDRELITKLQAIAKPVADVREMIKASQNRQAIASMVSEFRAAKKAEGVIDYADQIRLAYETVNASSEVRELVRDQYQVVLLDEYQDTSVSQKRFLQELFGQAHPVMAVGDPCQAIYGWRGADVSNIENFKREFPRADGTNAQTFKLSYNRRSGQLILDAANTLSDPLRQIHQEIVELKAGDPLQHPSEIHTGILDTQPDEVVWVCDQIEAQINAGKQPKDVAILLRAAKFGGQYVAELEKRNIPVQVADAEVLINLPEVRDVLSYLDLMAHPTANTALVRLLSGPRWRIGARDLALLGKHARQLVHSDYQAEKFLPMHEQLENAVNSTDPADQVCLLDALEEVQASTLPYSSEARSRMTELASQLRELRRHVGASAIDAITRIIRETGIGVEALAKPAGPGRVPSDHLGALIDLAGSYRSLEGESDVFAFLRFIADCELYEKEPKTELAISGNAVVIMTAHKAKGLEFPVVAVPLLSKEQFPGTKKDSYWMTSAGELPYHFKRESIFDPEILAITNPIDPRTKDFAAYKDYFKALHELDETRLAYVAATRAKNVLIASGSYWGTDEHSKPWGPTLFLTKIAGHATTRFAVEAPDPSVKKNPHLKTSDFTVWPGEISDNKYSALQIQANMVRSADPARPDGPLTESEAALLSEIDSDISALLGLLASANETTRIVKLPDTLTASQLVALQVDEQEFIRSLIRPLPRKPAPEAVRGTEFHAWVEDYFGQRTMANLIEELPGLEMEVGDESLLEKLKAAFKAGQFASRMPHELEFPFALIVAQRPLIGRIDAVFKGSVTDPAAPKWTVIDWKTGAPGSANPLQLHIYRAAWAGHLQIPLDQVEAAFYYVGHDHLEVLTDIMTVEQLSDLI